MKPASAHNSKDFYLISEAASILKVSTHTIRNLENEFGIEVKKDSTGKRVYTFSDIEKYKLIIEKKNSFDLTTRSVSKTSIEKKVVVSQDTANFTDTQVNPTVKKTYSSYNSNILPIISSNVSNLYSFFSVFNFSNLSKFSFATFIFATVASFGSFFFDSYMDLDSSIYNFLGANTKQVSNVLQATDENWDYRFDVNVPAFFNNSLVGSSAAFDLITVGDRVIINPNGISAPNIINTVRTLPNEEILLVDITDANNPIFSITNNPTFDSIEVGTLNGVKELDATTITTIENSINIPTSSTDAETIGGLAVSDFLRSNANTAFTNGILTFDASSTLKFNNINPNTFLRVDESNNLMGYSILPGLNVDFTSTANSLTINITTSAIATQNYNSIAVNSLFLGTAAFDSSFLLLATASEINKLHTLAGNLLTSTNLLTIFPNIDTDSTNDILTSNLASSILSAFPSIDTNAANDVLTSNLASLMLTNYVNLDTDATNDITTSNFTSTLFSLFPNIDTNASNDSDILQDAVLIGSNAGKNVYSQNIWLGYQDFNRASASIFEVENNGKISFDGGVLPAITDNALYSYDDILYFQESPLALLSDHTIVNHNNKYAFFTTNAFGKLQLSGSAFISLASLQSGAASSILGMDGNTLRYLNVTGDLTVSTTSSSNITFTLNTVNSNTGTFGSDTGIPVITVNSKGLITSVSTVPYTNLTNPNNYVTAMSFSTPAVSQRILNLQRQGLADLTASFTINSGDITSALNYTPLKNTSDNLTGNLGVSGIFSAATGSFTNLSSQNANFSNLTLANALSVIYGGTGNIDTPQVGQLLIGNGTGYTLSALTAGANISISTGAGSITISGVSGGTNANNYVNAISFSDATATIKTLILSREGLANLTASFSISAANVTSALGYTPFNASNFTSTQIINTLGYTPLNSTAFNAVNITNALGYVPFGPSNFIAGSNISLSSSATSLTINSSFTDTTNPNNYVTGISFSDSASTIKTLTLTRDGLSNLTTSFSLSSSDITSALGYTPLKNTTDTLTGNLGVSGNFSASTGFFTNLSLANALPVIFGGTGLNATPNNGQLLIGNGIGYTLSSLTAGTNVTISTGAGSITISAVSGGTNANNYVTGISFSDSASTIKTLTLTREGLSNLTASFSLSLSDITSALGYTPLRNTSDTLSGNLTIIGTLSASTIFQNGNRVCDLTGNCAGAGAGIVGSGNAGFISLFTATNSIANSSIYQSLANGYIGIGTTNPGELLDVYGAIKLSQNMGTEARGNALYQDNGVLYWNGQAVGVVGSTAPGGISGTKDYIPFFNTKDTLIASEIYYNSGTTERSIELIANTVIPTYLGIGHKNQYSLKLGVAANTNAFYTVYDSEDDVALVNTANISTADMLFALENTDGKILFMFGKNNAQTAPFAMTYNSGTKQGRFGINTTNPTYNLEVIGSAKITDTLAARIFSNPDSNNFVFLSGGNFNGNLSAGSANLTGLTLASALGVAYGGTGLIATPNNGQLLIGNGTDYTLSTLTAGTNVSISNGTGSITISSIDTNNYVTALSFSDAAATVKTFTLTQNGLSNLTATFSISAADITSALGYTPVNQAGDTITGNLYVTNTLSTDTLWVGNGFSVFTSNDELYLDTNNGAIFRGAFNSTYTFYESANQTIASFDSEGSFFNSNLSAAIGTFTNLTLANALTVGNGGTGLSATPTAGQLLIGNGTDYTLSTLTAGTNVSISNGAGSITISSIDTNNYVTALSFSDAAATVKTFTLTQNGLSNLTATFSISAADITSALGYIPFGPSNFVAGTNISLSSTATSLTINSSFTDTTNPNNFVSAISFSAPASAQRVLNLSRTGLAPLTADFTFNQADIFTALGYTPLSNSSDFMTGSLGVATSFSAATGTFTNLTLANALAVIYGGTGITNTPNAGQFLIGNGTGYTLSGLTAGTGISITTGAGSVTINSSVVDTNNYVTGISFSDASSTIKSLTLTQNGLSNLVASFSISSGNITSALGFTPVNKAGDTMSGSLTILQTLSAQDVVVLDNFIVGDYNNSAYTLQIEPKVGTLARKIVLDLTSGSQTETTLGMYIQSVRFSAPSSAEFKNLTFNQISSTNNLILDILKAGTLPAVSNGVLDTYNSQVSAASLYLAANTTNTPNIRFTSSAGVNVAAPSAGDLWFNGTSLNFYNGSQTIDLLSNPLNFFGSQLFSGANTTLADGAYIEVAHNSNSYDVVATGWLYNTLTSKWEQISPNQGANPSIDLIEYSSDNLAVSNYTSGTETIRTASGGTLYYTDSTGLNSSATPYVGGYVVHTFIATGGDQTFTTNYDLTNVTYLVAGAGGAGGRLAGGGGGGADVNTLSANNLTMVEGTYTITVGGAVAGLVQGGSASSAGGNSGASSTVTGPAGSGVNIVASGGCGGAGFTTNSGTCAGNGGGQGGSSGVSGGPGAGNFAGGTRSTNNAGGGGGMGGVGGNASANGGGNGGVGITSTISGATVIYGAGGGGGGYQPDPGGAGGSSGIGGVGGDSDGNPAATAGTAHTGSGGGGGGYNSTSTIAYASAGGAGGIVIIRYPYGNVIKAYSESTIKTEGSYSLKVIAGTDSLNTSLTKTFANGSLNLSYQDKISFYMRSSRTGSNVMLSIIDSSGAVQSFTPYIVSADTWQRFTWDISGDPTDRDNITSMKLTMVNTDQDNTFYLDDIATNLSYKIQLNSSDTARLYNYSGQTQNMRLVVSAKSSALFEYALGYTPLRNDSDYMRGTLGVTGSFSAASAQFPNLFATAFSASTADITNSTLGSVTLNQNLIGSGTSTIASSVFSGAFGLLTNLTVSNSIATPVLVGNDYLTIRAHSGIVFNANVLSYFDFQEDNISRFKITSNSIIANGYFSAGSASLGATTINGNLSAAAAAFTNLGVTTNLSAANATFTNLNAGTFSGTAGFLTNFGVTTNLSAANATFTNLNAATFSGTAGFLTNFGVTSALSAATATFRGTVTVSNPSGGTRLNLVSNGGSGNNIELGFYNGADKRANFSMDSTNTFEFEGVSGVDVHFNATNGTYRFFNNGINLLEVGSGGIVAGLGIRGTSLGLTGNLSAANATFTNLNAATFSGTAGFLTNFGVTTNLSAANATFTNLNAATFSGTAGFLTNFGVTTNFSAANARFTTFSAGASTLGTSVLGMTYLNRIDAINEGAEISWSGPTATFENWTTDVFQDTFRIWKSTATTGVTDALNITNEGSGTMSVFIDNYLAVGTAPSSLFAISAYLPTSLATGVIRLADGAAACTGDPATGAFTWTCSSDISLKKDVVDSKEVLSDLMRFRIREYTVKSTGERATGVIAQEVQQEFPDMVSEVDAGILGVANVNEWLLVKGIQELNTKTTQLSSAFAGMNLASMQSVYDQFMTTIENLSMSTEDGSLVVNTNLTVTGDSLFNNATFTGDVAIGQIKFDSLNNDISINGMDCTNIDGTLNTALCETQTLFVMKNKAGNLNFFDGKVVINPLGEMTVEKITAGEVAAAKVKASEYQVVAGSEVSGNTQILSGQTEITILTSKVKANSKVFVTANGDLGGRSLYVSDKVEGVSFKVKLNQALSSDVNFDWFILNTE